ncbi:major outer membrane protein [Campylobacter sp. LR196d]|uniref:major outer membrane protein n=1 Tax=Campylobacter sp. LR196d TaxID=2593543 RepID=UPI001238FCA9|nr:major outer membrane protein [Campylobacter sp. LR196d]KAA6227460.1 major outer membrane protein [Campylobacter sp. LR196d]
MKITRLSLVATLTAGVFSSVSAISLEEAIKDVDLSGVLRYRYNSGAVDSVKTHGFNDSRSNVGGRQDHGWLAQINFNAAIADNFKAFIQLAYEPEDDHGFTDGSGTKVSNSNTTTPFTVRQFYLTYESEEAQASVLFGKQAVNSIWSDNGEEGLIGTGVKILNQSVEGWTFAAYAFDGFNVGDTGDEGDVILSSGVYDGFSFNPYSNNLYGVAAIGSWELWGFEISPQLWLAYLNDTAFFYALDIAYATTFGESLDYVLEFAYLGNAIQGDLEEMSFNANGNPMGGVGSASAVDDGNFFALQGAIEYNGFDASLGGVFYGNKGKLTINTLEDNGNIVHLLAGEEIFYTDGSNLTGDIGQNIFGYVTAGYTFQETFRVGVDFIYGGTKTKGYARTYTPGGEKMEAVARLEYQYSPKLNFSAFYSYMSVDGNNDLEGEKNTVRLEALYQF